MSAPGWTTPSDIRAWIARRWDRGSVLATVVEPNDQFPLRVPLKVPPSAELATRFDEARSWVAAIRAMPRVRVETRRVNHRQLGAQEIPAQVWIDTVDDAAVILGRTRHLASFRELAALTDERLPAAAPLLARRPLDVLDAADDWPTLLTVAQWVLDHPRPGVYVRQVDLPGVHTKLLEQHRNLLTALFDELVPADGVDITARRGDLERRFGFRSKPRLVRFRTLDQRLRITSFDSDGHYLLTAADFARLPAPNRVFITENEVNFLALPATSGAIAIFGAGSGLEHLAEATWLGSCPVYYWGDIDTHGFWILDQLRAVLPHAESLLMDRGTLMDHRPFWVREQTPTLRDLRRLTPVESHLYDDLRDNRIAPNLRLEQERIRFGAVRRAVQGAQPPSP